jgi:predicted lipid-binding transport protein (Tim44 family)
MEALILIGIVFFFAIGLVFEVIGFIFRMLFSGFGLVIGLVFAAVAAIFAVPLLIGLLGFIIPRGFIVIGVVVLTMIVLNRSHQQRKDNYYSRRHSRSWYN